MSSVVAANEAELTLCHSELPHGAVEVARLWITNGGPATCLIRPDRLAEPEMFGMLMVDAARHAAEAFARHDGLPFGEVLNRIWRSAEQELARQATVALTPQSYERSI